MIGMRAHVLRHRRWGHAKRSTRLTHVLTWVLHAWHGLIVLAGHSRAGRHWMRIKGPVHGVRWVLDDRGLRVGRLRRLRRVG